MDEASSSTGVGAQGNGGGSGNGDGDGAQNQEEQPLEETLQQQGPKKDKKGKWAKLRGQAAKLLGRSSSSSSSSGKAKEEEESGGAIGRGGGERRRRTTTVREELERAMRAAAGRIERGDVGARGEAYDEMEAALAGLVDVCFKKAAENAAPPQCFRSGNWTSTQPMQDPIIVPSGYTVERGSPGLERGLCPVTKEPLPHPYAHPNHLFSDMIAAWLADHHRHRQRQQPPQPPNYSDVECTLAVLLDIAARPRTRPLLALRPGAVAALLGLAGAPAAPAAARAGAAAALAALLARGRGGAAEAAARRAAREAPGGARALLGLLAAEEAGLAARKDAGAAAAALLADGGAEGRARLREEGAAAAAVRALCVEPPAAEEAVEILERATADGEEGEVGVGRRIGEVMRVAEREGLLSARGLERAAAVVRRVAEREARMVREPYESGGGGGYGFGEVLRRGTPRARELAEETLHLIAAAEAEEEEEMVLAGLREFTTQRHRQQ